MRFGGLLEKMEGIMILLAKEEEKKYKEFLEAHDRCNFQQSLEWGKVKESWTNEV